jgi:GT2 family glycosyltransferase
VASIYAHIVLFNSPACVLECLSSLLGQQGGSYAREVSISVTDNASSNGTLALVQQQFGDRIGIFANQSNLGFCGANNQAAKRFLEGTWDYFLLVNPDLRLEANALEALVQMLERHPGAGSACPLLYRADGELNPLEPKIIDAAGMYVTPALRHLDRGSGLPFSSEYGRLCYVFGGSGACLLMRRRFVEQLLLDGGPRESDSGGIYPALNCDRQGRAYLFDEAFFAYREDADLAWRGQLLGWRCVYVPLAVGYHQRLVVPEKRPQLPAELNRLSVRNRFLLQLNNFLLTGMGRTVLPGLFWRNLMVLGAILCAERNSIPAVRDLARLVNRALARRAALKARITGGAAFSRQGERVGRWFCEEPYTEPIEE